jgi:predicted ribosome-associated RNA-binding protein Tma20
MRFFSFNGLMKFMFLLYDSYINVCFACGMRTDWVDPDAFTPVQVDRGAIKFVLSGANIMYSLCLV